MTLRTLVGNVEALQQFRLKERKLVASIIRSGDLFRFVEEQEVEEPADKAVGLGAYTYPVETHVSGLYASRDEALAAAIQALPWLASARASKP